MSRILSQAKYRAELIALYAFLVHIATLQGTQSVFAKVSFIARGLGWGAGKTKLILAMLRKMNLIETIKRRDDRTGRISGWYVRVRFAVGVRNADELQEVGLPPGGEARRLAKRPTILCDESHAEDRTDSLVGKGRLASSPDSCPFPSEDTIWEFADENELDPDVVGRFMEDMESSRWKIRGQPVRDWRRTLLARAEKVEADRSSQRPRLSVLSSRSRSVQPAPRVEKSGIEDF